MSQLNLLLTAINDQAVQHAHAVLTALADGDWHTRRQLEQVTHLSDRTIRAIAEGSRGQVISGQLGYKLTRFATVEEIDHAERWLLSQAAKMKDRALEIRRARNQGGVAA